MSKNIVIQEGGVGKQLTADKLKTNIVGVGTCLWVPEDEVRLGTKSVSENGTYVASNDGYYGYSQFSVSGVGTATGRDPVTGQEKMVTVDPETGDLVETVLPVEIRVTTPPTKTEYQSGETINISGMVVKAYGANGDEMQAVPLNQITINPTVAPSASEDTIVSYDASRLEDSYVENPLTFVKSLEYEVRRGSKPYTVYTVTASSGYFMTVPTGYYFVSDQSAYIQTIGTDETQRTQFFDSHESNIDGQTVTIASSALTDRSMHVMSPTYPSLAGNSILRDMYRLLYMGYGTMGNAEIAVSWPRTGGGRVLETTFDINVTGGGT